MSKRTTGKFIQFLGAGFALLGVIAAVGLTHNLALGLGLVLAAVWYLLHFSGRQNDGSVRLDGLQPAYADIAPLQMYSVAECRCQLQRCHPDKGGDRDVFELWRMRLAQARARQGL